MTCRRLLLFRQSLVRAIRWEGQGGEEMTATFICMSFTFRTEG